MWDGQLCSHMIDSLSNDKNNSTFTFVIIMNVSRFDIASKKNLQSLTLEESMNLHEGAV